MCPMLTSSVQQHQGNPKSQKNPKSCRKVDTDEGNLHIPNDMRNFNEIFRKYVPYDNIESHKKPGP